MTQQPIKPILLDKGLQQIILYCKGWFKETDLIDDLKILISKRCSFSLENVKLGDVYQHLLMIIKECSDVYSNKNCMYQNILSKMFEREESVTVQSMIKSLKIQISDLLVWNTKNQVLIELGEPDYTWLPPAKNLVKTPVKNVNIY